MFTKRCVNIIIEPISDTGIETAVSSPPPPPFTCHCWIQVGRFKSVCLKLLQQKQVVAMERCTSGAGPILGDRLRRWPSISPLLGQRFHPVWFDPLLMAHAYFNWIWIELFDHSCISTPNTHYVCTKYINIFLYQLYFFQKVQRIYLTRLLTMLLLYQPV